MLFPPLLFCVLVSLVVVKKKAGAGRTNSFAKSPFRAAKRPLAMARRIQLDLGGIVV